LADLHDLFSGALGPGVHRRDEVEADDDLAEVAGAHGWRTLVVPVGDKAATLASFSEVARFPVASTNWDSLQDWLGDLSWLGPADGYLVLLERSGGDLDPVLVEVLTDAGLEWAERGTPFIVLAD
jgi:hypothetical protein